MWGGFLRSQQEEAGYLVPGRTRTVHYLIPEPNKKYPHEVNNQSGSAKAIVRRPTAYL